MKNKGWLVIGSATLIAVGYALYDFQAEKRLNERKSEQNRIVRFDRDQISQVEISTRGEAAMKIRLARSSEGWRLEEPLQELADQNAVTDFVEGIATEQSQDVSTEGEEIDWKVFGLDEPRGFITVQNNMGERVVLAISSKRNYQGEAFLRRDQEKKVLLAGATWFVRLERGVLDFRDKRLLRRPMAGIESLTYSRLGDTWTLNYLEGKWSVAGQPEIALDQNKVRELLGLFNNPVITDFVKNPVPAGFDLKPFGLNPPKARVVFKFNEGAPFQADVGTDKDKYDFVLTSEPSQLVKISAADAVKFTNQRLDILRDRKGPFAFNKSLVKRIEVEGPEGLAVLEGEGETWKVVQKPQNEVQIGGEIGASLLTKLAALEVAEFLDSRKELTPKFTHFVRLKDAGGAVVFELKVGPTQKRKTETRTRTLATVQSSLLPGALITIDDISAQTLNLNSFLRPAPVPESAGAKGASLED